MYESIESGKVIEIVSRISDTSNVLMMQTATHIAAEYLSRWSSVGEVVPEMEMVITPSDEEARLFIKTAVRDGHDVSWRRLTTLDRADHVICWLSRPAMEWWRIQRICHHGAGPIAGFYAADFHIEFLGKINPRHLGDVFHISYAEMLYSSLHMISRKGIFDEADEEFLVRQVHLMRSR